MFLKINVSGEKADFSSFIFGKNPDKNFVSSQRVIEHNIGLDNGVADFEKVDMSLLSDSTIKLLKKDKVLSPISTIINKNKKYEYRVKDNELIRCKLDNEIESHFIYTKYTEKEVEAILFNKIDSLTFSKEFNGYVNEKEYLVNSTFQSTISDILKTAMVKEDEGFNNLYDLTYEIGPFKPNVSLDTIKLLFTSLGYKIEIKLMNEEVSFDVARKEIIFLTLKKNATINETLKQIYVLISAIDKSKHFKPTKNDAEKFEKFSKGWIEKHPLRNMITERFLSYTKFAAEINAEMDNQYIDENEPNENINTQTSSDTNCAPKTYGENGLNLTQLRYEKMKEAILKCGSKNVLDLGCGTGSLLKLLVNEDLKATGLDSSVKALMYANTAFKNKKNIEIIQGSLYYKDSRLKGFDTVVLCEVIEHIEYNRVHSVIDNILFNRPDNFILSTPNKDFNKFFEDLTTELRYYDHRFEFTSSEFLEFCTWVGKTYNYSFEIESFGKEIDGIKPTLMVTFKNKELF